MTLRDVRPAKSGPGLHGDRDHAPSTVAAQSRILVIMLGALGDFVQAFAGFKAIRQAHPHAQITLLTTPPFAEFAHASGLFDEIETDGRPSTWLGELKMLGRLRSRRYHWVYDLQTHRRSNRYFYALLPNPPEWSGIAKGCSHPQRRSDRNDLHNLDRIADQLHDAGVAPPFPLGQAPVPDLSWVAPIGPEDLAGRYGLSAPFALLAPGASCAKVEKFWPSWRYADLAKLLTGHGLQVGLVGGEAERGLCASIAAAADGVVNLAGRTSLLDLAALGRAAALAVGNDSGPVHLLAYAGAPGLMLMSKVTDPNHCAPRANMAWIRRERLADLTAFEVFDICRSRFLSAQAAPALGAAVAGPRRTSRPASLAHKR